MKLLVPAFLIGCMAAVIATFLYPPFVDRMSLWALLLAAFIAIVLFLQSGDRVAPRYVVGALVPWVAAAGFLANGRLDTSAEIRHPTVVIEERYSYRSAVLDTLVVRSWRDGRTTESVPVHALQPFFNPGDRVSVGIRPGAFGLPWISSVTREPRRDPGSP